MPYSVRVCAVWEHGPQQFKRQEKYFNSPSDRQLTPSVESIFALLSINSHTSFRFISRSPYIDQLYKQIKPERCPHRQTGCRYKPTQQKPYDTAKYISGRTANFLFKKPFAPAKRKTDGLQRTVDGKQLIHRSAVHDRIGIICDPFRSNDHIGAK